MKGDAVGRVYDSVLAMRDTENIRAMFERGEDPYAAMVQRGRELGIDVWPSIRMNDQHFWEIQDLEAMQQSTAHEMTELRKQHPEWVLGDAAPGWCATSWNMAIPEVREHKLDLVAQACRLADWDGVELDWQRHAFHLPEEEAYRLRYVLTDLARAVRLLCDQHAQERGRLRPRRPRHLHFQLACQRHDAAGITVDDRLTSDPGAPRQGLHLRPPPDRQQPVAPGLGTGRPHLRRGASGAAAHTHGQGADLPRLDP